MRLVHTADWHLGKKLLGYDRLAEQGQFLDWLDDLVGRESIDAVLVAGDIFDRSVPPVDAIALFGDFLERMAARDCSVVAIAGNHDSPERLGFGHGLFERAGIHLRTSCSRISEPVRLHSKKLGVDVYALPFADPHMVASEVAARTEKELDPIAYREHGAAVDAYVKSLGLSASSPAQARILLAHTFCVGGQETPESERPISAGGVGHVNPHILDSFDFVALGHLHRPQRVAGREHIRYAGSPFAYSIPEHSQKKSISIVELERDANAAVQVRVQLEPVPVGRSIVVIRDRFESLLSDPAYERHRNDYVSALYSDETYVLNAAARLQERFPFLLQALSSRVADVAEPKVARTRADSTQELLENFWSYAGVEHTLEPAHIERYEKLLARTMSMDAGQRLDVVEDGRPSAELDA